jgi:hypothetical protein
MSRFRKLGFGDEHRDSGLPVKIQYYEGDVEYDVDGPVPVGTATTNDVPKTTDTDKTDASSEEVTNVEVVGRKSPKDDGSSSRKMKMIVVGLCLLIAAVIATSVVLAKKSSTTSKSEEAPDESSETGPAFVFPPTGPPTAAPTFTERFGKFYDLATLISGDRLEDEESPQFQALRWLVYEDEANIDLGTTFAINVIERYAVATLFFATNGDTWTSFHNYTFLSEDSVCEWNDADADSGVFCNFDGYVNRVNIGKWTQYLFFFVCLGQLWLS